MILFLHTVIPHHHEGDKPIDGQEVSLETADSIMDYIAVMFLIDLGEGHMDNYHSVDGPIDGGDFSHFLADIRPSFILEHLNFDPEIDRIAIPAIKHNIPPPKIPLTTAILRGPPSFIG